MTRRWHWSVMALSAVVIAACGGPDADSSSGSESTIAATAPPSAGTTGERSSTFADASSKTPGPTTTADPPATTEPATTVPLQTSSTSTPASPTSTTTTLVPELRVGATRYVVPSSDPGSSWADTHAGYTATDIFVPPGCGGDVVSPASGVLLEVRRIDGWDPAVDNPATRGGQSITILGDDGVRYYLAHFADIDPAWVPGAQVGAGDRLGSVGTSGRSSACHIHFGISPPCPDKEWSVRRGAIWPYQYLDAWRRGEQLSPVDEIAAWVAENPDACALAALDPYAGDS